MADHVPVTSTRWALAAVAVAVLALVATGCGDDDGDGDEVTASSPSAPTATSAPSTGTTGGGGGDADVRVYFVRGETVATAGRAVEAPAVARGALEALVAGPTDDEAGAGMGTEVPDGTEVLGVDVSGGAATADLSAEFASGGGSLSMQVRVAQVVFTLTQFDSVDTVDIHLDGEAVDAIGGEGVPAQDLDRGAFEAATPFILVESPVPGATVTSPLSITGIANTFEANVQYEVTGAGGEVLDAGFTTATAGSGVWGDFEIDAAFDAEPSTTGTVVVFQEDAAEGGRVDVYEVPVQFG